MNDVFTQDYMQYAREKLRPAVQVISARKRSGMLCGLIAGLAVFACGVGVVYMLLAPYRDIMKGSDMTFWPLLFLVPTALAVLVFSLVFVLSLRKTVTEFRDAMAGSMAEFIDPGVVHENDHPLTREMVAASHLFGDGQKVSIGKERFRGRAGEAAAEFADVWVKSGDGRDTGGKGLFFAAHYDRPFPHPFFVFPAGVEISRSGLEGALNQDGYAMPNGLVRILQGGRQYLVPAGEESVVTSLLSQETVLDLDGIRGANGGELYLSGRDNDMYMALLSPSDDKKGVSVFEGFDFDGCREFCRNAKMAMTMARRNMEREEVARKYLS